jgi:hypothetical protein
MTAVCGFLVAGVFVRQHIDSVSAFPRRQVSPIRTPRHGHDCVSDSIVVRWLPLRLDLIDIDALGGWTVQTEQQAQSFFKFAAQRPRSEVKA